jgi:hypothetical protein
MIRLCSLYNEAMQIFGGRIIWDALYDCETQAKT